MHDGTIAIYFFLGFTFLTVVIGVVFLFLQNNKLKEWIYQFQSNLQKDQYQLQENFQKNMTENFDKLKNNVETKMKDVTEKVEQNLSTGLDKTTKTFYTRFTKEGRLETKSFSYTILVAWKRIRVYRNS